MSFARGRPLLSVITEELHTPSCRRGCDVTGIYYSARNVDSRYERRREGNRAWSENKNQKKKQKLKKNERKNGRKKCGRIRSCAVETKYFPPYVCNTRRRIVRASERASDDDDDVSARLECPACIILRADRVEDRRTQLLLAASFGTHTGGLPSRRVIGNATGQST